MAEIRVNFNWHLFTNLGTATALMETPIRYSACVLPAIKGPRYPTTMPVNVVSTDDRPRLMPQPPAGWTTACSCVSEPAAIADWAVLLVSSSTIISLYGLRAPSSDRKSTRLNSSHSQISH